MPETVVITEKVIVADTGNTGAIDIVEQQTTVEIGDKIVEVISAGQIGPPGPPGPPGQPGSGINAQQIQSIPVSSATPNEGDVLVSHGGTWTPERLNGGYF